MKPVRFNLTLSPEAVAIVRTLIYGDIEDKGPSLRTVARLLSEIEVPREHLHDLRVLLGLEDE